MTAEELRKRAEEFREKAREAREEYFARSRELAQARDARQGDALRTLVTVWECVSRRYFTWASALDEAAAELDG